MGSADAERGREDEPDDDRYADLPPARVTVPDDARDLEPDVRAYYRELKRRAAAGPYVPPPPAPPGGRQGSRPARLFIGAFALLLIIASLAMMVSPRRQGPPEQAPLATSSGAGTDGLGDGLLMLDIRVRVGDVERPLRDLRPAVFALVPADCACEAELETVIAEATNGYSLTVYLVESPVPGAPGPDGRITPADPDRVGREQLLQLARRPRVRLLTDDTNKVADAYRGQGGGLVLVFVAADGVVVDSRRGSIGVNDLDLKLAQLSHPDTASTTPAAAD